MAPAGPGKGPKESGRKERELSYVAAAGKARNRSSAHLGCKGKEKTWIDPTITCCSDYTRWGPKNLSPEEGGRRGFASGGPEHQTAVCQQAGTPGTEPGWAVRARLQAATRGTGQSPISPQPSLMRVKGRPRQQQSKSGFQAKPSPVGTCQD